MKDDLNRRQPQWMMASTEESINVRQHQWKTNSAQWKMTSMKDDLNWRTDDHFYLTKLIPAWAEFGSAHPIFYSCLLVFTYIFRSSSGWVIIGFRLNFLKQKQPFIAIIYRKQLIGDSIFHILMSPSIFHSFEKLQMIRIKIQN